jgi:6-pyruvoyltetrahydropterin/6-carboxytetrahydropterin synthase
MQVSVTRETNFNAAHRLYRPDWDDARNNAVFGLCNNPHFHGHNYKLIVKLTGPIDPETGYVIDLKIVNDMLEQHVVERFDHRNLNLDCIEFKDLNPTAENIAVVIWKILRPLLPAHLKLEIKLYETPRNAVEFDGAGL